MSEKPTGAKGLVAEEVLRSYFLESGYFVVRGVPLVHEGQSITDVDLWLYLRKSAMHRTRANVDIKARQKAKAFERVLWAKGVQTILDLNDAIVATTDRRSSVKSFAHRHGVKVLDGAFLQRLESRVNSERFSEEELREIFDERGLDRLRGNWRERLGESKSRLLTCLDFHGCNFWLNEICHFLARFAAHDRESSALRAVYLNLSYFHVGLDFRYQSFAFEPEQTRLAALLQGFQYGEQDVQVLKDILREVSPELAREIGSAGTSGREIMLAKFYAEQRVVSRLFEFARRFEAIAFAKHLPWPEELEPEMRGIIGLFSDYAEVDRRLTIRGPVRSESSSEAK